MRAIPFVKPTYTIAVRSLVEFVLRSGDLNLEFTGTTSALEGIRAHQRVQQTRPADYQAEVPVSFSFEQEDFILQINGRIDGVLIGPDSVVVEEIKSTRRDLAEIEAAPSEIHWGQAMCYAYLFALQASVTAVDVQLTYVNLDSRKTVELKRVMTLASLDGFFNDLVERYLGWVRRLSQWGGERNASIARLEFPFASYRPGQREMAVAVYRTIRDEGHLLAQAATGIGKTMAVLFPAVKATGEQLIPKFVFLTARTTGRLAAETALAMLADRGLRLKRVSLTAKEKVCLSEEKKKCTPDLCPYAKGHFDRLNGALEEAFAHDAQDRALIDTLARKHQVCPFEFSLELVSWADCVIGDYNYVFDPNVRLQRLFGEGMGRPAVLVDEAHNLVDRSREMFSAALTKQTLLRLRRSLKAAQPGIYRDLGRINTWMAALRRKCRESDGLHIDEQVPEALVERLRRFIASAERWLRRNIRTDFRESLLQLFFEAIRFVRVAEKYNSAYVTIAESVGEELQIKLFCMDPADQLRECWQQCRAAVLFSATMMPADYFNTVLGCPDDTGRLNLPSPFNSANLAVFLADHISTFYKEREASCGDVVQVIASLVLHKPGNYLLFFPSYAYLQMVRERFCREHPDIEAVVQSPEMGEEDRESFLDRFAEQRDRTMVGFAVLGGIFGEGIDLIGDRLTGAVIVGVGLPGISPERDLIRAYYEQTCKQGYEFAYRFPGINRVLQAAGRVIRSETDRGVVLLVDRRYGQQRYRMLMPDTWRLYFTDDGKGFVRQLERFWIGSTD